MRHVVPHAPLSKVALPVGINGCIAIRTGIQNSGSRAREATEPTYQEPINNQYYTVKKYWQYNSQNASSTAGLHDCYYWCVWPDDSM